jgi:Ca2+-binding EF-hand superfamily protein
MFSFDLYDEQKTGVLSLDDLDTMLREIFSGQRKLDALVKR